MASNTQRRSVASNSMQASHAPSEGRHSIIKTVSKASDTRKMTTGSSKHSKKTITSPKSIRLSDMMAAMYPGLKIGHKNCVEKKELVPKTMGWLWNTEDTSTGEPFPHGWRPGAIALGVRKKSCRNRLMSEPLYTTPTGSKGKKVKKKYEKSHAPSTTNQSRRSASSIEIDVPPTLFVHKEHGVYQIKMRPIKKKNGKDEIAEEQPVQFQIADSLSSHSQISKSSSSIKIEYLCTGALRKPVVKPEITEMGTQWDVSDFEKKKPVQEKVEAEDKKQEKKVKKKKMPSKEEEKNLG